MTYAQQLSGNYERLHMAKENAFWTNYMGLSDDADAAQREFEAREIEFSAWLQDPERLARTREELEKAEQADAPEDEVTALRGWVRTLAANAIESEEGRAIAADLIEREGKINGERSKMKLGYRVEGEEFRPASSVKLSLMIANDPDERKRKAAWLGLREIEPFVLGHGFLDLVKRRNRLGRMHGAEDYYDWKTRRTESMSKREIFALLDQLEQKTRDAAQRSLDELRREKGDDAIRPWNIRFHAMGDVSKELDPYFPFAQSFQRWGRSFAALGIGYRGGELVLDLVDRKGKFENGFCHGPEPSWRDRGTFKRARVQFTANAIPGMIGSGKRATETFFHEGGHAAHFANVDMPAPCFSQEFAPTSVSFAETQSMFLDSLLDDADWQTRYAKTKEGGTIPFELIERSERASQAFRAWMVRSMLAVCYCERAIYEIPDAELTAKRVLEELREWEKKLLFLGDASPRPALSIPHLISGEASAYYHGYVLALMAVHQTRRFFEKRDGHLLDNSRIGADLRRVYWAPGNSKRFPEFIRELTGETVSPDALAEAANRTPDEAVAKAREAVARLSGIPERTGRVDLDATIRIVHGNEEIATTADGFEGAATAFADWIESLEGLR